MERDNNDDKFAVVLLVGLCGSNEREEEQEVEQDEEEEEGEGGGGFQGAKERTPPSDDWRTSRVRAVGWRTTTTMTVEQKDTTIN
jgi:hypothetical protein